MYEAQSYQRQELYTVYSMATTQTPETKMLCNLRHVYCCLHMGHSRTRTMSLHEYPQLSPYSCLRFDRAFRCLPFDGIGARHPGMAHSAGARSRTNGRLPTTR